MTEHDVNVMEAQIAQLESNYKDACERLNAIYGLLPSGTTEEEIREEIYQANYDPIDAITKIVQILEEGV
jgi:hypothetical protein